MRRGILVAVICAGLSGPAHAGSTRLVQTLWRATETTSACGIACPAAMQLVESTFLAAQAAELDSWRTFADFSDGTFGLLTTKRLPVAGAAQVVQHGGAEYASVRLCAGDPHVSDGHRAELSSPVGSEFALGSAVELVVPVIIPAGGIYLDASAHRSTTAAVLTQIKGFDSNSPPIAVRVMNDGRLAVTIDNDTGRKIVYHGPLKTDRPIEVRLRAVLEPSPLGQLDVTVDGDKATYRGPIGYVGNAQGYYFKYGLYNSGGNVLPRGSCMRGLFGPMRYRLLR